MPSTLLNEMSKRIRIGILTPSSNTVLEPLSQKIIAQLPEVSVHFSRFTVHNIALSDTALAQFDNSKIIEAAKLLADAYVDVIGWSGTSSGWLGFEQDEKLCAEITAATGIPATTSVLALNKLISSMKIDQLGLVTPHTDDVQQAIVKNYATIGVDCRQERHLGQSHNAGFADIPVSTFHDMVGELVESGAKHISVFCTGLNAAQRVHFWEERYGICVLDTVATVMWDALKIAGVDVNRVKGWGSIFNDTST
jgi:maleate isomerase